MAAAGPDGGYVEVRTRTGWGTFWRVMLGLWTAGFAWQVIWLIGRAGDIAHGSGVLVALLVRNALSTRLIEAGAVWLAGAILLGLACVATRARRSWVPVSPRGVGAAPPVRPVNDRTSADNRITRVVIGVLWSMAGAVVLLGLLLWRA